MHLCMDLHLLIRFESAYAEIVWWTRLNDSNGDFIIDYSESQDLFRRVLLINPELNDLDPVIGMDSLPTGVTLSCCFGMVSTVRCLRST